MEKLIIKKISEGVFTFTESSNGTLYDGIVYSGAEIECKIFNNGVLFGNKNDFRTYQIENISYFNGSTLVSFANIELFLVSMKDAGLISQSKLTDAQLRATPLSVIPLMTSGGNLSVTTNATGTTFNAFASQACKQLNISNQTGTTIEVQQGGAGVAFQIPSGAFYTFFGITNANQLAIRRTDVSNTTVTVTARWEV